MQNQARSYTREFNPSWRSTVGSIAIVMGLAALLFVLFALVNSGAGFPWGSGLGALSFGFLFWFFARAMRRSNAVLSVSPDGIGHNSFVKGQFAWPLVADVRAEVVQGNQQIVVRLLTPGFTPKKSWFRLPAHEKRIALSPLRSKDQPLAIEAALTAFAIYGGNNAAAAVETQREETRIHAEYEALLDSQTPVTWALYLVMGINVVVWAANIASGMSMLKPTPAELFRWGANSASAVMEDGQYWRLLTATFLHGGFMHIAFNMLGLWGAGQMLNRLYGNLQFLLIYFGSALAGSALSLHFSAQQSVSVGASGAVFGVLGALVLAMLQHRENIPALTTKNVLTSQGIFLAYALMQGFAKQGVDNAAHVGGLICGALVAWLLVEKIDSQASSQKRRLSAGLAALLASAAFATLVVTTPAPSINHRKFFAFQEAFTKILPLLNAAEKPFMQSVKSVQDKKLTPAQLADEIESRHLPAYKKVNAALAVLDEAGFGAGSMELQDLRRGNTLMMQVLETVLESERELPGQDDPDADAKIKAYSAEIAAINARVAERAQAGKAGH